MIVLCRHGATAANLAGAFLSSEDPPLDEIGRLQAKYLREPLAQLSLRAAFTSPMRRCVQTLELAAPSLPATVCAALREISFGQWEGRTIEWLERHDSLALAERNRNPVTFRPPGGENFLDVAERLHEFAGGLLAEIDRPVLVVAHRGTLGVLERLLRRVPIDAKTVAPLEPGQYRIVI